MLNVRTLAILSLTVLACLATTGTASSATAEKDFWAWFQANEDRLYHLERYKPSVSTDLMDEIARVNKGLAYEISPPGPDGRRELVLSADGNLTLFPVVEALYDAAPELVRWSITQFRPREPLEQGAIVVTINGKTQRGEMRYIMTTDKGKAAIDFFLPGAGQPPTRDDIYIARLHLQVFLGEEDFGRYVQQMSVLSATDERYSLSKPMADLPAEFDAVIKN